MGESSQSVTLTHPQLGRLFDSGAELSKSVVRELFTVQAWALDGASAAILHLTQSARLSDYLALRSKRLAPQSSGPAKEVDRGDGASPLPGSRDKFLKLYLNKTIVAEQRLIKLKALSSPKKYKEDQALSTEIPSPYLLTKEGAKDKF